MKNQQNNAEKPPATLIKAGALYTLDPTPRHEFNPVVLLIPGKPPQISTTDTQKLVEIAKDYGPHTTLHRPDVLILPPIINTHAHLDLYAIGPRPYPGSFTAWLSMVIQARRSPHYDPAASVLQGLRDSRAAGVSALGDIAGAPAAVHARVHDGLPGVSYLETLGFERHRAKIAAHAARTKIRRLNRRGPLSIGVEPHAPYSTHALQFRRQNQPRRVLRCTHLAETPEEARFLQSGSGPFRDLLEKLNRFDPAFRPPGVSPVAWFASLVPGPWHDWALVHCNYVSDDDIALLARHQATVVYCPIASEYFGHKNHRYRDMLQAGVRVTLGTDSAVCQPSASRNCADLWPALQRLHQRDAADPAMLLKMACANAREMLFPPFLHTQPVHLPPTLVRFEPAGPHSPLVSALRTPQNAFALPAY